MAMNASAPYNLAIARTPNVIRRTAREVTGDVVLGFGLTCTPVTPSADHITCDMVWAGSPSPATVKSCLDALCQQFGTDQIAATVRHWLSEVDCMPRRF